MKTISIYKQLFTGWQHLNFIKIKKAFVNTEETDIWGVYLEYGANGEEIAFPDRESYIRSD